MIHKIKYLYDEGNGMSFKGIAKKLSVSKNTVKKYAKMKPEEIARYLAEREREKRLDKCRDYIISRLNNYEKMSATKIKRKCEAHGVDKDISERTYRRYVSKLKKIIKTKQLRNYEPVIDMLPGVQCQVDPGEIASYVAGKLVKVYFCVFVLSYSRLMYVSISKKPITTSKFIEMHNEAFSYFEGVPEECVYDQTKLVVIKEKYREVWHNEAFSQYAATVNFSIRVCEGYDPESKGKVEAGVKYVKNNFFYGEEFSSYSDIKTKSLQWLNEVANTRIHGTHKQQPLIKYEEEEKRYMKPFLKPKYLSEKESFYETRKVDKTSLISYLANKYSVPSSYQMCEVYIAKQGEKLVIMDKENEKVLATHLINYQKGVTIKNTNHYRDHEKTVKDRELEINKELGEETSNSICKLLKTTNPRIYKDQLVGLLKVIKNYKGKVNMEKVFSTLKNKQRLKVSEIENYLEAFFKAETKDSYVEKETKKASQKLSVYAGLNKNKGANHVNV